MRAVCVSMALLSLLLAERGAHASELVELTLSCDGTITSAMTADSDKKPESVIARIGTAIGTQLPTTGRYCEG
jgi:hypothetical protein